MCAQLPLLCQKLRQAALLCLALQVCGACWLALLTGLPACCPATVTATAQAIATQPLELPGDVNISTHLRDLFMRLFDKDPNSRITLQVSSTRRAQQAPLLLRHSCSKGASAAVHAAVLTGALTATDCLTLGATAAAAACVCFAGDHVPPLGD